MPFASPARPYWPHSQAEEEPAAPPPPDCPGRCNAPFHTAEERRTAQGIDHELEPRPGEPVWCRPCTTSLRGDLTDWPALAPQLAAEVGSGVRATTGEYVSGSKAAPVHQHEALSLLLDEAAHFLTDWAATIAHDHHVNGMQRPEHGNLIDALISVQIVMTSAAAGYRPIVSRSIV